jgi:hypothetical protein
MPAFSPTITPRSDTLVLRIGTSEILMVLPYGDRITASESATFVRKSGMSATANLREAFKTCPLLQQPFSGIQVLADAPTMLVPEEEFRDGESQALFDHVYKGFEYYQKASSELPELHSTVVYAIEKDILTVIGDHSEHYQILPTSLPVWRYMHRHEQGKNRRKLFAYFHDEKIDVFSFSHNRFIFANTFKVDNEHDALYFILYTWSQMKLDSEKDELHMIGDVLNRRWLSERINQYLRRPFFDSIEPLAGKMAASCKPLPADVQALADL